MLVCTAILLFVSLGQTYGHGKNSQVLGRSTLKHSPSSIDHSPGEMYYPIGWYNQLGNGLTLGPKPDSNDLFRFEGPYYPQPEGPECEGPEEGDAKECSKCRGPIHKERKSV